MTNNKIVKNRATSFCKVAERDLKRGCRKRTRPIEKENVLDLVQETSKETRKENNSQCYKSYVLPLLGDLVSSVV
jgi:hypothetical protein